jgi:hypothetical protein
MALIDEDTLLQIERAHPAGVSSAEILDIFASHGIRLSEATMRKYVQLGLLPRSVRVGQKGKHQGSKGMYPVRVVRQILQIKKMMAESYTIEQIQKEFLFMRSDLEELEQTLERVFESLDGALKSRSRDTTVRAVARDVGDARQKSRELLVRLQAIENKLTARGSALGVKAS